MICRFGGRFLEYAENNYNDLALDRRRSTRNLLGKFEPKIKIIYSFKKKSQLFCSRRNGATQAYHGRDLGGLGE